MDTALNRGINWGNRHAGGEKIKLAIWPRDEAIHAGPDENRSRHQDLRSRTRTRTHANNT